MGDAISNQFKNSFVKDLVNTVYNDVGAGDAIPMSDGVKNRYAHIDSNRDNKISRNEMTSAIINDGFKISLENGGRSGYGIAPTVVNFMDEEDGIRGGQIRVSGNMIDSGSAARNLANGNWVVGKVLATSGGSNVLEVHQNKSGPKITLPN